jgi:hypothetical protein
MTPQVNPAGDLAPVQMSMDQLQHLLQQLYHPPTSSNPKVKDPELYYGKWPKLRAFLTQCELKFNCEPNKFHLDAKKVNYTSSWCRGNAWAWIKPSITKGQSSYKTWEDFKTAITQAFGEADSKEVARRKFKSIRQGNCSAAAYWAEFQPIMADLDYNDPLYIDQFNNGLHIDVQRQLALLDTSVTNLGWHAPRSYCGLFGNMDNRGNDYDLLLGNQELEGVGGIRDLQRAELWWSFR